MDARSKILDRAIALHAGPMGAYLGARFAESCRRALTHASALAMTSENEISMAVAAWANDYMDGVKAERDRILAIDAIAAQMPAGYAALAKKAKFESCISADEFAVQALDACRASSHAMPAGRPAVMQGLRSAGC